MWLTVEHAAEAVLIVVAISAPRAVMWLVAHRAAPGDGARFRDPPVWPAQRRPS